jgi:hypothetical protein
MKKNFQEAMKDRIRQGFGNWNQGYEAWLKWCDELYEPDAYYNFYGGRHTLQEYKDMMGQFFSAFDIQLGELHCLIAENDWIAIHYDVTFINKKTGVRTDSKTMECVHFKDNPDPIGARVIEGWAIADKPLA